MAVRWSLRYKFAYTFLAAALLTVLLFSIVIKRIMTDYFNRQRSARLTFIEDQGAQEVRSNFAVFNKGLQQYLNVDLAGLFPVCESGVLLGDRLPQTKTDRERIAALLRGIQAQTQLSMITVVGVDGKVIDRATNPDSYGDDALMRDYENTRGPVSSIKSMIGAALAGKTITAYEVFAPEILAKENEIVDGKVVSSLAASVKIPLKSMATRDRDGAVQEVKVPNGQFEERALMMTVAEPVRDSKGSIVGAVIAGRSLNKDLALMEEAQTLTSGKDQATIWLGNGPGGVRIATTRKVSEGENRGQNATGTLRAPRNRAAGPGNQEIDGELFKTATSVLRDYDNNVIGSMSLARPLSLMDSIAKAQEEIGQSVDRRTTFYIVGLGVLSVFIAILVATIFSTRITRRIDQLGKGAEVIARGNLDHRLEIHSGDEIELLASQFNAMASKLHESYQSMERKVEERTRELKESQQAMVQQEKIAGIGQLAAGIAHEMNTPLGTIIGYAQMLREDLTAQPSVHGNLHDVDEIIEQAGRCRDLVKNLLNFSRRSTTEKSEADVNIIIRKILSLVEHDFELKHIRIRFDLNPDLPKARVNENEIAQVMLNLANNAADSMPQGGEFGVSTTYEEGKDRIRIDVHDNGCGIRASDRTRVFEPFFTTKDVGKGTGLGLSICYKIVENHMGSLEFDSVVGEGTAFRIFLPVNAESPKKI